MDTCIKRVFATLATALLVQVVPCALAEDASAGFHTPAVEEIMALLENRLPPGADASSAAPEACRAVAQETQSREEAVKLAALFTDMEKASSPEEYIRILKRIATLPDYRSYAAGRFSAPAEIPFDRLSADQASSSLWWYDGSGWVEAYVSPEAVKLYNDLLFPRYQAFFRKMASREVSGVYDVKVTKTASTYNHWTVEALDIARVVNPIIRERKFRNSVIVMRTQETSYRDFSLGDTLKVEISIFEVADAYKGNMQHERTTYSTYRNNDNTPCVAIHVQNQQGENIKRYGEMLELGPYAYSNSHVYVFAGFGLGDDGPTGNVYLKVRRKIGGFSIPSQVKKPEDGVKFAASCTTRGDLLNRRPVVKAAEKESEAKEEEGFWEDVPGLLIVGLAVLAYCCFRCRREFMEEFHKAFNQNK